MRPIIYKTPLIWNTHSTTVFGNAKQFNHCRYFNTAKEKRKYNTNLKISQPKRATFTTKLPQGTINGVQSIKLNYNESSKVSFLVLKGALMAAGSVVPICATVSTVTCWYTNFGVSIGQSLAELSPFLLPVLASNICATFTASILLMSRWPHGMTMIILF
jgi:hypothetical protein